MEFKAKAGMTDWFLAVFTDILLVAAVIVKAIYKLDILIVILLLAVSGFGCSWYVTHQPTYRFEEKVLKILEHPPFKNGALAYDSIIDFRVIGSFSSINPQHFGKVLITYSNTEKGKYRNQICTPADVYGFVAALRERTEKSAAEK